MSKNTKPITKLAFATISVASLLAQSAHAQSELLLISGATTIAVPGIGGEASYNGSVGGWTVDVSTGLASPLEPADTIDLNSVSLTIPGTAAPLEILWSAAGYTPGPYFATVGGTLSAGITDSFTSYYGSFVGDPNIASDAPVLTSPLVFNSSPFSGTDVGVALGGPPVLTQEVLIGGGILPFSETSFNYNLSPMSPVPEPSTIGLLLVGGASLAARKFKRTA